MTFPNAATKFACAFAAVCAYFLAAHWLRISYAPDPNFAFGPDVPGEKIRLCAAICAVKWLEIRGSEGKI